MDGHGTSPMGRCEGSPDPSEVSSLGKLSVFLILNNLITRNDITDLERSKQDFRIYLSESDERLRFHLPQEFFSLTGH